MRRSHNNEGAEMGLMSRQANCEGRGEGNRTGRGKRDQMGRGARAKRDDAWRSQKQGPATTDTTDRPQVEVEREC